MFASVIRFRKNENEAILFSAHEFNQGRFTLPDTHAQRRQSITQRLTSISTTLHFV
jgi:hypothetical protein